LRDIDDLKIPLELPGDELAALSEDSASDEDGEPRAGAAEDEVQSTLVAAPPPDTGH
jgi:hypothetical protein